jgi:polar amino acid transport system substrate-binding protein
MRILLSSFLAIVMLATTAFSQAGELRKLHQIINSGELRVGVSLADPWTMKKLNGALTGSEIDIADRIAADMGIRSVFKQYDWDALVPALRNGEIDIIIAGVVISPDKALQVNFSRPYASAGISLMANTELTKSFKSAGELNSPDVAIGAVSNTTQVDVATRVFSKAAIKTFPTQQQLVDALLAGKLHAAVALDPEPRFLQLRHPDKIDLPLGEPLINGREGLAIRQGDADFLAFLNAWIESREADGWLRSTHEYWFDGLKWQEH